MEERHGKVRQIENLGDVVTSGTPNLGSGSSPETHPYSGRIKEKPVGGTTRRGAVGAEHRGAEGAEDRGAVGTENRGAEGAEGAGVWGGGVPLPTGGGVWGQKFFFDFRPRNSVFGAFWALYFTNQLPALRCTAVINK